MPNQGFPDPFINCCFINDNEIAVMLFYNYDPTHYHFIYDHEKKKIKDNKIFKYKMKCNKMNHPYKSFYNKDDNVVYTFYRQGQVFNIKIDNIMDCEPEEMTD